MSLNHHSSNGSAGETPADKAPSAPATIVGRARVPRYDDTVEFPAYKDDVKPAGNRLLVVSLVAGAVVVSLTVGLVAGFGFGRPKPGESNFAGQQPRIEAIISGSPTPTPTASPSPSGKPTPTTTTAQPANYTSPAAQPTTAGPNYEGKIITSGGEQYYVKGGKLWPIVNAAVSACVSVRSHAGAPVTVAGSVVDAYPTASRNAHCAYENQTDPGRLNFVTEDGSWIWLVDANGVRHHVGAMCPGSFTGYAYEAHQVPVGETAGHVTGSDWFGDDTTCAALPN